MTIEPSIVRLESPQKVLGSGFVIADGLVMTCAHVVADASGRPLRQLSVTFHTGGVARSAEIVPEFWRSPKETDIAVLSFAPGLPHGVIAAKLGSSDGTRGHVGRTFGYPEVGKINGIYGHVEIRGRVEDARRRPLIQVSSKEITSGFSGAPLFDVLRRRVIGMVSEIAAPDKFGRLDRIAFATPSETLRDVCPFLELTEICPYRGLLAYTESDAEFFFGRGRVTEDVLASLRREPRFVALLGPSGSGKSSVLHAGVLPNLRQGRITGDAGWHVFPPIRPSDDPISRFERYGLIGAAARGLRLAIANWRQSAARPSRVVLAMDQFEEVFTVCHQDLRQRILTELIELLESSEPVTLILTMRDDFYSVLTRDAAAVASWLPRGLVNLPATLNATELNDVICRPAAAVGLSLEDGLADVIAADAVAAAVGDRRMEARCTVLPLLEFTLTQLWETRRDGALTHDAYNALGRVTGGLTSWADRVYYDMSGTQRSVARYALTQLVQLGDEHTGIPDTRRRRSLEDLRSASSDRNELPAALEALIGARLIVGTASGYELIHDALIREWGLLRQWLQDDRRFLRWRQECEKRADVWKNSGSDTNRDDDLLLRGRELGEAMSWLGERQDDLSSTATWFITASEERRVREEQRWKRLYDAAERHRQDAEQQRLASLAHALAAEAHQQAAIYHSAERAAVLARQAYLFSSRCGHRNLHFVDDALRAVLSEARFSIHLTVGPFATITGEWLSPAIAFAHHSQTLAIGGSDGKLYLVDVAGHQPSQFGQPDAPIIFVAFSRDDAELITGHRTGKVMFWNRRTGEIQRTWLLDHGHPADALACCPATLLAASASGATTKVWDLRSDQPLATLVQRFKGDVLRLLWTAAGDLLAAVRTHEWIQKKNSSTKVGIVEVWRSARNSAHSAFRCIGKINGCFDASIAVLDRDRLVIAADQTVGTLQRRKWTPLRSTEIDDIVPLCVAVRPGGDALAIGYGSGGVRWVDLEPERAIVTLLSKERSYVSAVAFSAEQRALASVSVDGSVRVWQLDDPSPAKPIFLNTSVPSDSGGSMLVETHRRRAKNVARSSSVPPPKNILAAQCAVFSSRADLFAIGFSERIAIMNTAEPSAPIVYFDRPPQSKRDSYASFNVTDAAFANASLVAASLRGIWRWNVQDGSRAQRLSAGEYWRVGVGCGGTILVAMSSEGDGQLEIWRLGEIGTAPTPVTTLGPPSVKPRCFAVHPDSFKVAVGGKEGNILLSHPGSATQDTVFSAAGRAINVLAWSANGALLAAACGDGIILIPTESLEPKGDPRPTITLHHEQPVTSLAFASRSARLFSGSVDGTTRLWDLGDLNTADLPAGRQLQPRAILRGAEDVIKSVAISPDGALGISITSGGVALLWRLDSKELADLVCHKAWSNLTQAEWAKFVGSDVPYEATCPNLPPA